MRRSDISPELLGVYASLVFVIGSLITLAASIISYREKLLSQNASGSQATSPEPPFIIL